jgi:putative component of membrane protein insertase Oxa1/YidC/SpoIIIJ protein YidD
LKAAWLYLLMALASQARAAWQAPLEDWTRSPRPAAPEAWERLAVRSTPPPEATGVPALLGSDLLYLWQHTLSGRGGSRCPHYPSCSRYSRIAIEEEGLLLGCVMTAERLLRCHDQANAQDHYAWRWTPAGLQIWDPPSLDKGWR